MAQVIIVMGVAGCGKTTIGQLLASRIDAQFHDADTYHSAENKQKMAGGAALTDEDRRPWLAAMRADIERWLVDRQPHVLACSALKRHYRSVLDAGAGSGPGSAVQFVYLKLSPPMARRRLDLRQGHYMHSNMVDSQFAALEEPSQLEALIVDAQKDADQIVAAILPAVSVS